MKIVFLGTPEFAIPTIQKIHSSSHSLLSVVTQPDRPKGRGQKHISSPIKSFAVENNIPVLQPKRVNTDEFISSLLNNRPDYIIVVAFGQILDEAFLKIPKQFCINLHSSLLPKYRGAAPINRAILNGDTVSGVTTIIMDKGMDTGDILLTKETTIELDDDALEVAERDRSVELRIKFIVLGMHGTLNHINPLPSDGKGKKLAKSSWKTVVPLL